MPYQMPKPKVRKKTMKSNVKGINAANAISANNFDMDRAVLEKQLEATSSSYPIQ